MLEDKRKAQKKNIKNHEIRVFLDAEYDPGIEPRGLSITEQMDYLG